MLRHLFLHIGMPKTGTTALQGFLAAQRKLLMEQGCYYPETKPDDRQALLVRAIGSPLRPSRGAVARFGGDSIDALQNYLRSFVDEINGLPASVRTVIVSAEHFSSYQDDEQLERLRDFLAPLFSGVTVIVYLRRQDAHFASFYTQSLRLGHVEPPNMDDLLKHHHNYDYDELLARWARTFEEANVNPRIFERAPGQTFDILDDFAALCGLTLPEERKKMAGNPSMTLAAQHALLAIGARLRDRKGHDRVSGADWHRITGAMTVEAPGPGWQPTKQQAREFVARFADSNERVRERWFPERSSLFNEDFDRLPDQPAATAPAEIIGVLCDVLLRIVHQGLKNEQDFRVERALLTAEHVDAARGKKLLVEALREDPTDVVALTALAKLQAADQDFERAQTNLAAALDLAPDYRKALRLKRKLKANVNAASS